MGKVYRVAWSERLSWQGVVRDNGRVINNGPKEVGTHKKDKTGVQHKHGPQAPRTETLDLNLNGEINRLPVNVILTGAQQPQTTQPVFPPGMQPINVPPPPGLDNHGKELQRKIHRYSLGQLPLDSSHHMDLNKRRDQLQLGNNRLLYKTHNSLQEEFYSVKDTQ